MILKKITYSTLFASLIISCSDKYKALEDLNSPPSISLSTDSIKIRVGDTITLRSELLINVTDKENNASFISILETKGKAKVLYDKKEIPAENIPIINTSTRIYIVPIIEGVQQYEILAHDRMGKFSSAKIVVKTLPNQLPVPSLLITQTAGREYKVSAVGSFDPDGIITKYHYEIDGIVISTSLNVVNHIFHTPGTKIIKVKVEDDAGGISNFITNTITVI
jgi:hypothetical protein